MRIYLLTTILVLQQFIGSAQKPYRCIYQDSTVMKLDDSIILMLTDDVVAKGLPPLLAEQFASQMAKQQIFRVRKRIVRATIDSTIIDFDESGAEGNLTINEDEKDASFMYKKDEIYLFLSGRFADTAISSPKKSFAATRNKKEILGYKCMEYVSTDTSVIVYITTELPSFINPGIRIGGIKGAVLAFELNEKGGKIKSEAIKVEAE